MRVQIVTDDMPTGSPQIAGHHGLHMYDPVQDKVWLYEYPWSKRHWLAGGTFCYRKAFWAKNPFPEIAVGEDTRFVWSPHVKNAFSLADHTFYVALIHPTNTSRKVVSGVNWHAHPIDEVHRLLGSDLDFYDTVYRQKATTF